MTKGGSSLTINDWVVISNLMNDTYKASEEEFDSLRARELRADTRCVRKDLFVKTLSNEAKKVVMEILLGSDEFFQEVCRTVRGPHGIGKQRFAFIVNRHFGYTFREGKAIHREIKTFLRKAVA